MSYARLVDAHLSPLLLSPLLRAHQMSVRVYPADRGEVKVTPALQ